MSLLHIPFIMNRDINGYNGFGLRPSNLIWTAALVANAATSITVPSYFERYVVIFSIEPGSNVWVAYNHTAAVPVGSTLAAANSELNPTARQVSSGDSISVITPDTVANISIALYYLPNLQ